MNQTTNELNGHLHPLSEHLGAYLGQGGKAVAEGMYGSEGPECTSLSDSLSLMVTYLMETLSRTAWVPEKPSHAS